MNKVGQQTMMFPNPPSILNAASTVGPKEGKGPLKTYFDKILVDDTCGESTYEKAEECLSYSTIQMLLQKENLQYTDIDYYLGGDLLNQIISTSFTAKKFPVPFFGLYNACATFSEGMQLAASLVSGKFAKNVVVSSSSHFSSAERQYRSPLESGIQRKMTAQWTVTGAGAVIISNEQKPPYITYATTGIVQDYGVKEADNMGTAMAPAAVETIIAHFNDTGFQPKDYDLIITGDLGTIGKQITMDLLAQEGFEVSNIYTDCGVEIFNEEQDTHARGSGAGCSATVFSGYIYKKLRNKELNRVLFVPTGALLSPTTTLQGDTIPCIAHAVTIENNPQSARGGI